MLRNVIHQDMTPTEIYFNERLDFGMFEEQLRQLRLGYHGKLGVYSSDVTFPVGVLCGVRGYDVIRHYFQVLYEHRAHLSLPVKYTSLASRQAADTC